MSGAARDGLVELSLTAGAGLHHVQRRLARRVVGEPRGCARCRRLAQHRLDGLRDGGTLEFPNLNHAQQEFPNLNHVARGLGLGVTPLESVGRT